MEILLFGFLLIFSIGYFVFSLLLFWFSWRLDIKIGAIIVGGANAVLAVFAGYSFAKKLIELL